MPQAEQDGPTAVTLAGPSRLAQACTATLVALILAATLVPGSTTHALLSPFPAYVHADKLGHAIGFAGLGFSFVRSRFARIRAWHIVAFAFVLGSFTEFCQLFIPGRTGRATDVLIDVAAACVGVYLAYAGPSRPGSGDRLAAPR